MNDELIIKLAVSKTLISFVRFPPKMFRKKQKGLLGKPWFGPGGPALLL